MKRLMSVTVAVAVVALLAGVTYAQMGRGPMSGGMGMMGPGMMGGQVGPGATGCPGLTAGTPTETITADKAKEIAQKYADEYLKGFTVERVLPFTGMHHTMYSVELKGPKDEVRTFHINPWGNVMPFGGAGQRAG